MDRRSRKSPRLPDHDYRQPGAYLVTICTKGRACLFGEVVEGEVRLSPAGEVAAACWRQIPTHHLGVALDTFVVMPNHVHGIVLLLGPTSTGPEQVPLPDPRRDRACPVPTQPGDGAGASGVSLSTVVGSFKSAVTREANRQSGTPGAAVWQPRFHDHVVRLRDPGALDRVRRYVAENPARWRSGGEGPSDPP